MRVTRRFFLCLFLAMLPVLPVRAEDHDRARRALQAGEIRPLDEVLRAARAAVPGDVVAVELEHDDGRWIYEIKVLTPQGDRRDLEIDASTLRVLDDD